jgi:hypothetical protein
MLVVKQYMRTRVLWKEWHTIVEESWSNGTSTGKGYKAFLILRLFDQWNNIRFGKLMVNSSNLYRGIVNNHPKLLEASSKMLPDYRDHPEWWISMVVGVTVCRR